MWGTHYSSRLNSLQDFCRQSIVRYDEREKIAWLYMNPSPRPCITPVLLEDVRRSQHVWAEVNREAFLNGDEQPVQYTVLASAYPGIYSYGGDLSLFIQFIKERDAEGLRQYAYMCIDDVYLMAINLHQPVTTIALVQGDALGGGFEAALSCNYIVAEKGAQFGFPEILFNLFPGMGAYSFLSRKIGMVQAEKMITSGKTYTAEEMFEMGVVDFLVEKGRGEDGVYEFVRNHRKKRNAHLSLVRVRQRVNPVTREELIDVADMWVETAMKIGERELKIMERLVRAQDRLRTDSTEKVHPLRRGEKEQPEIRIT
ncbi:MAG: enoyl-CoA hydratase [Deltaproteobacteria bacterium]|nr:MAG: enoyl-CoA hydratase [Deltaproteobacteria bacterium]